MGILHHVNHKDFKKTRQRCLDEQELLHLKELEKEILEQKENQEIRKISAPFKTNWRKELSEGMTSGGMFFTTFPSTGDTVLQSADGGSETSFSGANSQYNSGISFGSSGFNIGQSYVQFSGQPNNANDRYADTFSLDATLYTTVNVSAIAGNNTNGGTTPTANLSVYWFSTDANGNTIDYGLLGTIPSSGSSLTNYTFTLPDAARNNRVDIYFVEDDVPPQANQYVGKTIPVHPSLFNLAAAQWANSLLIKSNPTNDDYDSYGGIVWGYLQNIYSPGWPNAGGYPAPVSGYTGGTTGADRIAIGQAIYNRFGFGGNRYPLTYGISSVGYQRRTPVNVFVSLDSPQATSFIRTDPAFAGLSEEEKLKKLAKMLESSDEYLLKMFGSNFPGTNVIPPGRTSATPGVEINPYLPIPPEPEQIAPPTNAALKSAKEETAKAREEYYRHEKEAFNSKGPYDLTPYWNAYMAAMSKEMSIEFGKPYDFVAKSGSTASDNYYNQLAQQAKQREQNIKDSLNKLQKDKEQQNAEAVKRNWELAGNLAMDAASLLTLLTPLPGDEAAVISGRAAKAAADAAFDKAEAEVLKKSAKATAEKVARRSAERTSDFNLRMSNLRQTYQKNSYEPHGQVIVEKKKLKSPQEFLNKIPGYYNGKPAPLGFPEAPPPEMINGMHPDLVDGKNVSNRFNRLDPESAKAMPLTGNPEIDKKVAKARKQPK